MLSNVVNMKLNKHFFYFHQDILTDERNIDELLSYIEGDRVASTVPGAQVCVPKVKKKRKKNKTSGASYQRRRESDSISEDVSFADSASTASIDGAGAIVNLFTDIISERADESVSYLVEKSDQMKNFWKEFLERNEGERKVYEVEIQTNLCED